MKKLQYLIFLISLFVLPVTGFAATSDFVAGSNITVANVTFGSGTADMLIFNNSTAESWTFNSGTFTTTNPGSAFRVGSSDSSVKSIQISKSGSTVVCSENTTPGTSYATLPTSAGTYTISPSTVTDCTSLCTSLSNTTSYNSFPTCGASSCSAGYRVSGTGSSATCVQIGGGGVFQGSVSTIKPQMQTIYPNGKIVYHNEKVIEKTTPTAITVTAIFTKTLKKGMQNSDVKRLQQLLASDVSIYPEGLTTGYFGQLTEKAIQRFQSKYNIVSSGTPQTTGYGLVGPKTRTKLQEVFGQTTISLTKSVLGQQTTPIIFATPLFKGMSSLNVKYLQQVLNADIETQLASSGVGSRGNETNYFGSITEKAVQKFQEKYGIAKQGDLGYGYVGPKTRSQLNKLTSRRPL